MDWKEYQNSRAFRSSAKSLQRQEFPRFLNTTNVFTQFCLPPQPVLAPLSEESKEFPTRFATNMVLMATIGRERQRFEERNQNALFYRHGILLLGSVSLVTHLLSPGCEFKTETKNIQNPTRKSRTDCSLTCDNVSVNPGLAEDAATVYLPGIDG
jgi:hypothetical protein